MSIINETTYIGSGSPYDIVLSMDVGTPTIFNQNQQNIDFEVKGTGLNKSLFFDASTGRLGLGTGLPDAVLHVIAPCAKDGAIIESITNCPTGVTLLLIHNPQTAPQDGSIPATLNLSGRDDNYNEITYGQIQSKILNATTSETSGEIIFNVDHTGISKPVFIGSIDRIVLGSNNNIDGHNYMVMGKNIQGSGQNYVLIGSNVSGSIFSNSTLIGNNNYADGPNLLTIGADSFVRGSGSVFIGSNSSISGNQNLVLVVESDISGANNIALGRLCSVSGSSLLSIANSGNILGSSGIFLGNLINNSGDYNIELGYELNISGNNSSVVGIRSLSSGNNNIIYGNSIRASGNNILTFGSTNDLENVNNSVVIGQSALLTNTDNLVLLGIDNITRSGLNNSVVLGGRNSISGVTVDDIILIGHNNIAEVLDNALVIGNDNQPKGIVKNTTVIGSGNALLSESYNTIVLGTVNNVTGVYINSQGETSGTPVGITANNINTISIGNNNLSYLGSSNNILGNKNIVSGTNITSVGSFNNLRNTNNIYNLGNSNYIDGQNIVALGKKIVNYGRNSIVVNNTEDDMDVYGSGCIIIGNNPVTCSGIAVGYANTINSVSGLVFGKHNYIGLSKHLFTSNINSPSVVTVNALVGGFYKENDSVLLQVKNPAGADNSLFVTITSVSENPLTTQTNISLGGIISSVNLTDRYFSINNNFDENNIGNTTISGYIIALKEYEENKFYGVNSIIFGNNNNQKYENGIIVGNNNASTGINSIIIGHNISGVDDNSIHIGSSNSNKIVFNDDYIVFNTGTSQQDVVYRSFNGTTAAIFDLVENRLGINNNNPRSSLDVSGLITSSSLRMGLSTTSGHVLTANSSGVASWERPVRLSGLDNGLLYRVSDKVASGISSIRYTDATNGLNFYDNIYILQNSGILINLDKGSTIPPRPLTIWGSGGVFAPKLLDVVPGINRTFAWDFAATTGFFSGLNIVDNIKFPTSLTGTLLYVDNDGQVKNRVNKNNTLLFAGPNSWATGNAKVRWFDNQNVLTLSTVDSSTSSSVNVLSSDTEYNIMLSNTGVVNTVFNNKGLGNNFIVYNSGSAGSTDRRGFYIVANSGKIGINTTPDDLGSSPSSQLYVVGETHTRSLKIGTPGSFPNSGLYLRTASNGEVVATNPTFDIAFSGIYPIKTETLGGTAQLRISISNLTRENGPQLTADEEGKTLVWTGSKWIVGSGLQIWQDTSEGGLKGLMFGDGGSFGNAINIAPRSTNGTVFAGGSFNPSNSDRNGSSQFMQYHLRTRTLQNQIKTMTTNWDTISNPGRAASNVIRFPENKNCVWTYKAYINVMWQDVTTPTTIGAGSYVVDGTVRCFDNVVSFIGPTGVVSHMEASVPNNIFVSGNNASFPSLDFIVSGYPGYNMLWSSTVQINQLAWPTSLTFGAS